MTAINRHRVNGPAPWRAVGIVALTVAAFFLPRLFGGTSVAYSTLTTIAIFAVMCYGIDIVLSYLGEVSLGHTLFWAMGGYAAANLSVKYSLNGWTTALATIVLCLVAAAFLGAVTLRTREFVFSLVTYAAAIVAYEVAFNWDAIGGSDGIVGISALKLPFGFATFSGATQEELWPIALALLLLTLLFIARFRRSRLGTAALMVQMNPALAASLGIDPRKVRLAVFVISAPITGLAGWLYAYQRAEGLEKLLGKPVLRVIFETRVIHFCHLRMARQEACELQRIIGALLHAQRQCFGAGRKTVRRFGGERAADVAQTLLAYLQHPPQGGLCVLVAVVDIRKSRPVEQAGIRYRAAQRIAVAADALGQ